MKNLFKLDNILSIELIIMLGLIAFVSVVLLSSGLPNTLFFLIVLFGFIALGHRLVKSARKHSKNY